MAKGSHHNNASLLPQYVAAIAATISGFLMGTSLGWTSPAGPVLQDKGYRGMPALSDTEFSLISGLMAVGAMAGAGISGTLADAFGRRNMMIVMVIPAIAGWALMVWASTVIMMYIGRFFLGFGTGFFTVVTPMYTNEISQTSIQGTTGILYQVNVSLGILYTYVVGSYTSVFWLSMTCAIFPILNALLMCFMPESPRYYLTKGNRDKAAKSLQWLRGSQCDISEELEETQISVEKAMSQKLSMAQAFTTRAAKKGLVIGLGVMIIQQISGVNAVISFTVQIFKDAGSSLEPNICTIIVGSIVVVATLFAAIIVDRLGRKPLLFMSALVMGLMAILLGVFFYIKDSGHDELAKKIGWLPLISVSVFMIFSAIGFSPIPWILMAEIFPPNIRGPASSIACLVNWLGVVIITMTFSPLKTALGVHSKEILFWIYGVLSLLGALFVWALVPETKGKTIDEVVAILDGSSTQRRKDRTSSL